MAPEHPEPPARDIQEPAAEFSRENSNEDSTNEVPMADYMNAPQHPTASPPSPIARELTPEPAPAPAPVPVPVATSASIPVPEPEEILPPEPSYYTVPAQSTIPEHTAELLAKLEAAAAEITFLRATLATRSEAPPTELRQRTRRLSDATSVPETEVGTLIDDTRYHHQEGVPLQVVVIIALGVFITTYLFF